VKTDDWSEAAVEFEPDGGRHSTANEIRFEIPRGAQLLVDDLLLYVPVK
jgi:hypothetical protein